MHYTSRHSRPETCHGHAVGKLPFGVKVGLRRHWPPSVFVDIFIRVSFFPGCFMFLGTGDVRVASVCIGCYIAQINPEYSTNSLSERVM